jgi:anti-anti-sigma factor
MTVLIDVSAAGRPVLWLEGDIDLSCADEIVTAGRRALSTTARGATLVLDLGRVEFADSSALNALVRLRNLAVESGVSPVLRDIPDAVGSLLTIAGLGEFFPVTVD